MDANAPTITTQAELCAAWQALIGPSGFGRRSLWLMLLHDDGTPLRMVTQIEDLPDEPEPAITDSVVRLCCDLAEHRRMHAAFLLSRPGRDGLSETDRSWAVGLTRAARRAGLPMRPVHRANDANVLVIAPDDLVLGAA